MYCRTGSLFAYYNPSKLRGEASNNEAQIIAGSACAPTIPKSGTGHQIDTQFDTQAGD